MKKNRFVIPVLAGLLCQSLTSFAGEKMYEISCANGAGTVTDYEEILTSNGFEMQERKTDVSRVESTRLSPNRDQFMQKGAYDLQVSMADYTPGGTSVQFYDKAKCAVQESQVAVIVQGKKKKVKVATYSCSYADDMWGSVKYTMSVDSQNPGKLKLDLESKNHKDQVEKIMAFNYDAAQCSFEKVSVKR